MICLISLSHNGFQSDCQLIRAGSGLETEFYSIQAGNGIFCRHSFHKFGDTLQVAVAAACKYHRFDYIAVHFNINGTGTGTFSSVFHNKTSNNTYKFNTRIISKNILCYQYFHNYSMIMAERHGILRSICGLSVLWRTVRSPIILFTKEP